MTINYLSADMFTRIRNGQQNKLKEVKLKRSKLCINILDTFIKEGIIRGYKHNIEDPHHILKHISQIQPVTTI
jgi:ribosomal protein S8